MAGLRLRVVYLSGVAGVAMMSFLMFSAESWFA